MGVGAPRSPPVDCGVVMMVVTPRPPCGCDEVMTTTACYIAMCRMLYTPTLHNLHAQMIINHWFLQRLSHSGLLVALIKAVVSC